jgi:hypothetical protein
MIDHQMPGANAMPGQGGPAMMNQQHMPTRNVAGAQSSPPLVTAIPPEMGGIQTAPPQNMFGIEHTQSWQGLDAALAGNGVDAASQEDNWSNSSRSNGPTAPTTLNVEDWYDLYSSFVILLILVLTLLPRFQFFGINGGFGDLVTDPMAS